jgi:hypothetical protein
MPKNIEEYGELTLAMKNFEELHTVRINDRMKSLCDVEFIRKYQKAKAKLGDLLVDLMIQGKLDITVKSGYQDQSDADIIDKIDPEDGDAWNKAH